MTNWQFLFQRRLSINHGFWPPKGGQLMPIFEYWNIGPLEIRHFIPRSVDAQYNSLLDLTRPNNKRTCAWCGVALTKQNDSGWEVFTEDGTTQPTCIKCDSEPREMIEAKEENG